MPNKSDKAVAKGKRPKTLKAHITYLEMTSPLLRIPPVPTRPTVALISARNIPARYYSYLYELVGKAHHWEERRNMSPEDIFEKINSENCAISILYADGCPAGFFELVWENSPDDIEIKYMGLAPDYQGLGLGKWFIATAISSAWARKPQRVFLETNTLDHPAALPLYQKLGFSPTGIGEADVSVWE